MPAQSIAQTAEANNRCSASQNESETEKAHTAEKKKPASEKTLRQVNAFSGSVNNCCHRSVNAVDPQKSKFEAELGTQTESDEEKKIG